MLRRRFVLPLCRREITYDGALMLKGLQLLYQKNQPKERAL